MAIRNILSDFIGPERNLTGCHVSYFVSLCVDQLTATKKNAILYLVI